MLTTMGLPPEIVTPRVTAGLKWPPLKNDIKYIFKENNWYHVLKILKVFSLSLSVCLSLSLSIFLVIKINYITNISVENII